MNPTPQIPESQTTEPDDLLSPSGWPLYEELMEGMTALESAICDVTCYYDQTHDKSARIYVSLFKLTREEKEELRLYIDTDLLKPLSTMRRY